MLHHASYHQRGEIQSCVCLCVTMHNSAMKRILTFVDITALFIQFLVWLFEFWYCETNNFFLIPGISTASVSFFAVHALLLNTYQISSRNLIWSSQVLRRVHLLGNRTCQAIAWYSDIVYTYKVVVLYLLQPQQRKVCIAEL